MGKERRRGSHGQADVASKSYQLLNVPMVGNVLTWQETLAQDPYCGPLRRILADCLERILAIFQRYISDLVGKVAAYEARSALLGESVKGQHVLPFFRNFIAIAARSEDLVAASSGPMKEGERQPTSPSQRRWEGVDDDEDDDGEGGEGTEASASISLMDEDEEADDTEEGSDMRSVSGSEADPRGHSRQNSVARRLRLSSVGTEEELAQSDRSSGWGWGGGRQGR
eukprot:jgi/Botrbrau1/1973/Bobra.0052s0016.1